MVTGVGGWLLKSVIGYWSRWMVIGVGEWLLESVNGNKSR